MATTSAEPQSQDIHRRAQIRLELAAGYFEQGQLVVALDEVKNALTLEPNAVDALNLRGLIQMRMGELDAAEASFNLAIAQRPQDGFLLHNQAWLLCQQERYAQAQILFQKALESPKYSEKAKSWMTMGLCQMRAKAWVEAEDSLLKSIEIDADNPIAGFNLAQLLFNRGDFARSHFYISRINGSQLGSAESLWLGVKVARQLGLRDTMRRWGDQLQQRFPNSKEFLAYERGVFNE